MPKQHISETPATQWLKAHNIDFTEHPYDYLEHGGAQHSAQVLECLSLTRLTWLKHW